jgi:CHAD domain-containing protein
MAYRFKLHEPLPEGMRRIAREQLDMAEEKLAGNGDTPTAIHDARRCLKRLRALLRLVRPALDEKTYRREAERMAATGRLLAGARDLHVMRQTVAKLESRFGALPNGGAKRLNAALTTAAAFMHTDGAAAHQDVLQRLKQTRKFFAGKALEDVTFGAVAEGMERCYRKGRKAFRTAYRKPADEAFHAWRKAVQQHWRHMQLVSRAWPEALSARAGEAKELSRLLGEDHDLAVLLAHASQAVDVSLRAHDLDALSVQCSSLQAEIRGEAQAHGARLFAEPADDLRSRIEAYWSSARSLTPDKPADGKPVAAKPRASRRKTPVRARRTA